MPTPGEFPDLHYTPTDITAAVPVVVTIVNHGFESGQRIVATRFTVTPVVDATGMEQLNNRTFVVQFPTTDTFQLWDVYGQPINGTAYTPFISNGLAQFTLTGPDLNIENPAPPNIWTERIYPWMP